MISEASSAVQGLMAQVGGKTEQKGAGPGGFLTLLQGNSGGSSGKSGAQALLASLTGDSGQAAGDGTALQGEALQSALRAALSGLSGQGGNLMAAKGKDGVLSQDALEDMAGDLVALAQTLGSSAQEGGEAPAGLLNALARLSKEQGGEQAVAAVTEALNRIAQDGNAAQVGQDNSTMDDAALSELKDKLDSLLQRLEGEDASPAPANSDGQAKSEAPSLPDLLDSLESTVAQLKEAAGQDSKRQELLGDLQAQLESLQDSLKENGQDLDLASLVAAAEIQTSTTGKAASGQAVPTMNDALSELGRQFESLLQGLKAARSGEGQADGNLQAATRAGQDTAPTKGTEIQAETSLPGTKGNNGAPPHSDASRGQDAARDGEQASRQAAVTASAEQHEQLAQRQLASQGLSDKQAADLYETLRQAGKVLQNEAATQALERNLTRLSEQAGGMNRLAEALAGLQGHEESTASPSSSRGPDSLNALSFENQLRASAQAQQAAAQAQQAAKSQGGPAADQIAMKIHKAVSGGNDRISVQLHPAELGRVEVKLDFGQDGLLRASITAERPETLDLLQRDARALERALSDAGVKTDSGSLNFNARDTAGQQQAFDRGGSSGSAGDGLTAGQGFDDEAGPVPDGDDETRPGRAAGLINLSV